MQRIKSEAILFQAGLNYLFLKMTCYNGFIGRFRGISMQVDCLVGGVGLLVSKETYVVLCVEG